MFLCRCGWPWCSPAGTHSNAAGEEVLIKGEGATAFSTTAAASAVQEPQAQQAQTQTTSVESNPQQSDNLPIPLVQVLFHEASTGDTPVVLGSTPATVEVLAESSSHQDVQQQQPRMQAAPVTPTLTSPVTTSAQSSASARLEIASFPLLLPILTIDCARPSDTWVGCGGLDPRFFVRFEDVSLHEVIGKGTFKTVYRGRWTNTSVAVVSMRNGGLVTEAEVLQRLSIHPNLVQFYRWTTDGIGNQYLIMELLSLGSLDTVLRSQGPSLANHTRLAICEQLVSAMCELVAEGLTHGDLAVRNVLVKSMTPVHVKLADFGLSRRVEVGTGMADAEQQEGAVMVPVRWTAPEMLQRDSGARASEKTDVWSFAVTMWEVFTNAAEPYASRTDQEVVSDVLQGYRLPQPPTCPTQLYRLMMRCWKLQPEGRPTFKNIADLFCSWRNMRLEMMINSATIGSAATTTATTTASPESLPATSSPSAASTFIIPMKVQTRGPSSRTTSLPTLLTALQSQSGPSTSAAFALTVVSSAGSHSQLPPVTECDSSGDMSPNDLRDEFASAQLSSPDTDAALGATLNTNTLPTVADAILSGEAPSSAISTNFPLDAAASSSSTIIAGRPVLAPLVPTSAREQPSLRVPDRKPRSKVEHKAAGITPTRTGTSVVSKDGGRARAPATASGSGGGSGAGSGGSSGSSPAVAHPGKPKQTSEGSSIGGGVGSSGSGSPPQPSQDSNAISHLSSRMSFVFDVVIHPFLTSTDSSERTTRNRYSPHSQESREMVLSSRSAAQDRSHSSTSSPVIPAMPLRRALSAQTRHLTVGPLPLLLGSSHETPSPIQQSVHLDMMSVPAGWGSSRGTLRRFTKQVRGAVEAQQSQAKHYVGGDKSLDSSGSGSGEAELSLSRARTELDAMQQQQQSAGAPAVGLGSRQDIRTLWNRRDPQQLTLELAASNSALHLLGNLTNFGIETTHVHPSRDISRLTKSFSSRTTTSLAGGLIGTSPMHHRALMHNSLRRTQPASFSAVRSMHFDEDLLSSVSNAMVDIQARSAAAHVATNSTGRVPGAAGRSAVGALFTRSASEQLPPNQLPSWTSSQLQVLESDYEAPRAMTDRTGLTAGQAQMGGFGRHVAGQGRSARQPAQLAHNALLTAVAPAAGSARSLHPLTLFSMHSTNSSLNSYPTHASVSNFDSNSSHSAVLAALSTMSTSSSSEEAAAAAAQLLAQPEAAAVDPGVLGGDAVVGHNSGPSSPQDSRSSAPSSTHTSPAMSLTPNAFSLDGQPLPQAQHPRWTAAALSDDEGSGSLSGSRDL